MRAAVDRGVGADLDVVLDDHPADLRHLGVAAGAHHVAEPVLADPGARMHDHAVAHQGVDQRHMRADGAVAPDPDLRPDHRPGVNHRAGADLRARPDHRARIDRDAAFEPRARMNERAGSDAARSEQRRRPQRIAEQRPRHGDKGLIGRARAQHADMRRCIGGETLRGQADAGLAGAELAGIFRLVEKRQVGRQRPVERCHAVDAAIEVGAAGWLGAGQRSDLTHGEAARTVEEGRRAHAVFIAWLAAEIRTKFRRRTGIAAPGRKAPW